MENIALIGASGQIGGQAIRFLLDSGVRVRAASRTPEAHKAVEGLTWQKFDFEDSRTYKPFLEGIDRLFFVAVHPDPVPSVSTLLDLSGAMGLKQVVFSSGRTTGDVPGKPLHQVEQIVRQCGLPWTILRPGWFMQNFTTFLRGPIMERDAIMVPAGDKKTAFVDVRDIGEVVAVLLSGEVAGSSGQVYEITGAQAICHREVARIIGQVSGRTIAYQPMSEPDFIREMMHMGWSRQSAAYTASLYRFVAAGKEEIPSSDAESLLGRPTITFSQFAGDYAGHWRK